MLEVARIGMRSPGLTDDAACFVAGFSGGLALHVYDGPSRSAWFHARTTRHFTVGRRASCACDPAGRRSRAIVGSVPPSSMHSISSPVMSARSARPPVLSAGVSDHRSPRCAAPVASRSRPARRRVALDRSRWCNQRAAARRRHGCRTAVAGGRQWDLGEHGWGATPMLGSMLSEAE